MDDVWDDAVMSTVVADVRLYQKQTPVYLLENDFLLAAQCSATSVHEKIN